MILNDWLRVKQNQIPLRRRFDYHGRPFSSHFMHFRF